MNRESADIDEQEPVGVLAATAISQPAYQIMLDASPGLGSRKIRPLDLLQVTIYGLECLSTGRLIGLLIEKHTFDFDHCLQESLFPRSDGTLKGSDRRCILRLSTCSCGQRHCEERRILELQSKLQPLTLEMLATGIALEYVIFDIWFFDIWY
ncbi:hypothetical protein R1flu_025640 [Riccia fluitans]|uniref:Uncharacterized protein n=1 Tax=Riccia fluitans TaxID=41844 RepID=A0ABD1Y2G7_9MARC